MSHFHQAFANKSFASIAAVLSATILATLPVKAQLNWVGSTGAWTSGTNWSGGVAPTAADDATIGNNGTATLSAGQSGTSARFEVDHGAISISGGSLSNTVASLGDASGESGTATLSNGTWNTSNSVFVGRIGQGALTINGGRMVNGASVTLGANPTGVGILTVTGGTMDTTTGSGFLTVGGQGTGTFNLSGGLVSNGRGAIGQSTGGQGTVVVTGGTWTNDIFLNIGQSGTGSLSVSGGLVSVTGTVSLGLNSGAAGQLLISGSAGTQGTVLAEGVVKGAGAGSLTFDGGILKAQINNGNFMSGFSAGDVVLNSGGAFIDSNGHSIGFSTTLVGAGGLTKLGLGTLTLTGSSNYTGDTIVKSGTLAVSSSGAIDNSVAGIGQAEVQVGAVSGDNGAILLSGGRIFDLIASIGSSSGATGSATVNSGTWTNTLYAKVGVSGTGSLTLNGGLIQSYSTFIGDIAGSTGNVVVSGGALNSSNALVVGNGGAGTLLINGGLATDNIGTIGSRIGGTGLATVSGGTWSNTSSLWVGELGSGTLSVTDSGVVSVGAGAGTLTLGLRSGGIGTLNLGTGGTAGSLQVAAITTGLGVGTVNFNHTGTLTLAAGMTGSLSINKLGSGTTILIGNNTYTGSTTVKNGTLAVEGGQINGTSVMVVGETSGDNGSLLINGGYVSNANGYIGNNAGSSGTATVNSGTWSTAGNLNVGYSGTGALNVTGGVVSSSNSYIGRVTGALGTATVSGGTWNTAALLDVGDGGSALLNVNTGGYVSAQTVWIATGTGATGTVNVNGGTLASATNFIVGYRNTGTLNITNGQVSSQDFAVGNNPGSQGTVNLNAGGLLQNSGVAYVGLDGSLSGIMNVNGGTWSAGTINVGRNSPGVVTLNSGYISSGNVNVGTSGTGNGAVNVNDGTLAFGTSFNVGNSGTGTLNLTGGLVSGSLVNLGNVAASTGSATVSGGTLAVASNLNVGSVATGNLLINGGQVITGGFVVGNLATSTGTATMTSGVLSSTNSGLFRLAESGRGTLVLDGGLISSNGAFIGTQAGSIGLATVNGGTWTSAGLTVGSSGTGTLRINGGLVTTGTFGTTIGNAASGVGSVALAGGILETGRVIENLGTGTLVFDGGTLRATAAQSDFISGFEAGDVTINSGGASIDSNGFNIGIATALSGTGGLTKVGSGTLALSGSNSYAGGTTISAGTLQIGNGSTTGSIAGNVVDNGMLAFNRSDNVSFGGIISGTGAVTKLSTNQVTLTGSNSYTGGTFIRSGNLVGNNANAFGTGAITMSLAAGTQVVLAITNNTTIANNILVSASNAIITNINTDAVSTYTGSITLLGGNLTVRGISGVGSTTVTGNISGTGNLTLLNGLSSNDTNSSVFVTGSVNNVGTITHTGTVSTASVTISGAIGSNVTGVIQNSASSALVLTGNNTYSGATTVKSGTLAVIGGSIVNSSGNIVVGDTNGDQGTFLLGSGLINAHDLTIGNQAGSAGTATMTSGTWQNSNVVYVGFGGNGTLNLNGGLFTTVSAVVAEPGGAGTVNVNSGTWTNTGQILIGYAGSGTGTLNLLTGLVRSDTYFYVGLAVGANGVTTVSGGTLTAPTMVLGTSGGTGILNLSGGLVSTGSSNTLGNAGGSLGIANVSSGTWQALGSPTLGLSGTGVLNLKGGLVSIAAGTGTLTLAQNAGSAGTLNIGTGSTVGTLAAAEVTSGSGTAQVNFNHTGSLSFAQTLAGALSVNKLASGTTVLTGNNSYSGSTTISAGKLSVNGFNSGTGAVTVASGATLGGSGIIAGAVTVANGGILSPGNSPGNLTVGGLALNNMSRLNYDLGAPQPPGVAGVDSDLITVTHDVTLDGVLNMVTNGSFGTGNYRLINYGGALTDHGLQFGQVAAGYNLTVDTATSGQVNLVADYTGLQFWDGSQTTADSTVHGGSGTWSGTGTNWTNESGNANTNWAGLTAVFSNTGGTVTINGTKAIAGLQFSADDYKLKGNGVLAISASNTEFRIDPGLNASIANTISGSGGIVKTGGGIIALTGSSNYTGGTTLNAGTLRIGDEHALGTGGLVINGGTIGNAGSGSLDRFANTITANADFGVQVRGGSGEFDINGTLGLGSGTRTITLTGAGLASFGGAISGEHLRLVSDASGISAVQFTGSDSNTFNGTLTVGNGVQLLLKKTDGATAVAGDLVIRRGAAVGLNSNGQIATTSAVRVNGDLDLFQANDVKIDALSGTGTIIGHVGTGTLTVNSGNFSGSIVESGGPSSQSLVKASAGTLTLSGANSYVGGTVINAGVLVTNNAAALGGGPVALNAGGTLAPAQPLTINSMTWNGGTIALNPTSSFLTVDGALTMTATGVFALSSVAANTSYTLLTFSNTGSVITDFTANTLSGLGATFTIVDNGDGTSSVRVAYIGASSGGTLSNYAPVFTPTTANFIVSGTVATSNAPNTVNSLTFTAGSLLNVFNNLFVTSGNFTVNTGTGTIGGPGTVITPGDFNKLGQGVLSLLGNVFAGGNVNLNGGTLSVDGTLTAQNVIVALETFLKGHGVIFGNVFNFGTVAPGNSPGTLTISGNYTQSSSGALDIELASLSNFDRLIVGGNASLGGTLNVIPYQGFKLQYGQQFQFLQAGSISGSFDSIVAPSGFRGRILEKNDALTLLIAPQSYTQVAVTQNQKNVAKALNSYIKATKGDREKVSIALDKQTASQYPGSFDQIAPNFYESLGNTTIELANAQNQILAQRMSAVRLGVRGFTAVGMQAVLVNDKDGKSVMDAKGEKDILKITPDTKWGVWVQGNGIFAKVTNISDVPNYRYQSGGFTVGADYAWNEHLSTGVFTGYQGTYAKYGNGGVNTVNSALFGGYAAYQQDGFYSDAIIGGSYNGYTARRPIQFSTIDRTATSNPNGGQFNTYLDAGYDWHVNKFTFGPLVSGQYTYAGIAPFTEQGAKSLDLSVNQQNVNSLRTNLGGRIAYTWNLTDQILVIPELRMSWQHEFLNNSRSISASLDGGSGPSFNYQTANPGRDSVLATAGVSAQFGARWNGNFYYTADFGNQSFLSHMISAGLEWKF